MVEGSGRLSVVTGAFGFTGRYITRRLLEIDEGVRTLTGHPHRPNPFGSRVEVAPYAFADVERMARVMAGAATLYNTYWVRFQYGAVTFDQAVRNSVALFRAAKAAGIGRVVHISIANASLDSALPYYRGKARVEKELRESGLSHAILRPTVLFGEGDILINNIAWLLRRFPVFAIPGDGRYPVQPVHVDDVAHLAVRLGHEMGDVTVDAAGPDTFTYEGLVELVRDVLGARARVVHVSPVAALVLARALGAALRDVILTRDEVRGLTAGLLASREVPQGRTRLADWLAANRGSVGARYASELERHYRS